MEDRASLLVWFRPEEKEALSKHKQDAASAKEMKPYTWREFILDTYDIPYDPIPLGRPTK